MLERIGKYKILRFIADGGQGTVYQAFDPIFKRTCAVKIMNQRVTEDPGYLRALHMKTSLSTNLHHPGIVATHDCSQDRDSVYIATDYLPGSLARRMDSGKSLTNRQAVKTAHQIGRALAYAHKHGILHGNVKPENILFSGNGSLKVSDFGIAKCMAFSRYRGSLYTRSSMFYCSPEQVSGNNMDHRSDIYSLGKLLKEMVIGTIPLSEEGIFEGYSGQMGLPGFFEDNKNQIPNSIQSVVDKSTSLIPDDRYNNMENMISDLQKALRDLPEDLILRHQSELKARTTNTRSSKKHRGNSPNPTNNANQIEFDMPNGE